jgi:hypothetical protein
MNITHPSKIVVPVETGMAWGNDGALYSEKLDGCFHVLTIHGVGILAGEMMRGGKFIAWDCVAVADAEGGDEMLDIREFGAAHRFAALREICEAQGVPLVETSPNGGALLAAVLARGGEGIVRKDANASFFQPMLACKRSQIHVCTVTAIGPGQSIALADASTGQARGKCPAKGGAADVLRVGDRVRVECDSIHDSGLFRSAKLCRQYKISGP